MVENKLNSRGFFLIELLVSMGLLCFFIYLANKQIYFMHENISSGYMHAQKKLQANFSDQKYGSKYDMQ